jgi:hypothetical protein
VTNWTYPTVTDYWDQQRGAIDDAGKRLEKLSADRRRDALEEIAAAVTEHVRALPDELILAVAVAVADDLYKAASSTDRWDDSLRTYLEASAGVFFSRLANRGLLVQYAVDNAWDDLTRPAELFPAWYAAAGLIFICPQVVAFELIVGAGDAAPVVDKTVAEAHLEEARIVSASIVTTCQAEGRHLVYLETDSAPGSFDSVLSKRGAKNAVTIFRTEAPAPGSAVQIWYPTQNAD